VVPSPESRFSLRDPSLGSLFANASSLLLRGARLIHFFFLEGTLIPQRGTSPPKAVQMLYKRISFYLLETVLLRKLARRVRLQFGRRSGDSDFFRTADPPSSPFLHSGDPYLHFPFFARSTFPSSSAFPCSAHCTAWLWTASKFPLLMDPSSTFCDQKPNQRELLCLQNRFSPPFSRRGNSGRVSVSFYPGGDAAFRIGSNFP